MDDSRKPESPEARKQREVLAARDRDAALSQYKNAQSAEAVKTARLRALRLERDAAAASEAAAAKAKPKKAKTAAVITAAKRG
jgi:hypothetical protein